VASFDCEERQEKNEMLRESSGVPMGVVFGISIRVDNKKKVFIGNTAS